MVRNRIIVFFMVLSLLPFAGLATASNPGDETVDIISSNPIPGRSPLDLAVRLGGLDPTTFSLAPRPPYNVGDVERFSIGGSTGSQIQTLDMALVAATDEVYMWVQRGISVDPSLMQEMANVMSTQIIPHIRTVFGKEQDVEGDPHIYVLTVTNAGPGVLGLFNDTDRFPNEVLDSSNEINSLIMATNPSSPQLYMSVFAHEFQHLVQADLDESEETWFIEGFAELGSLLALPEYFTTQRQTQYVTAYTTNQLNAWDGDNSQPYYGAASLFLAYITQQYGEGWVSYAAVEPADGVLGIERALARFGATDPLTGDAVTFADVFADFAIANLLNDPAIGDGRYGYTIVTIPANAQPSLGFSDYPLDLSDSVVNQYGTQYILLDSPVPQTVTINFSGQESVNLLPTQPHSGQHFYWSQRGNQSDARLTGTFDLQTVENATLNFWTWYDIEEFWDYGYISVSVDGGANWDVLSLPDMTSDNPYDRAFAAGYSGNSGGDGSRPAAYIGFSFSEGLTVNEVLPGTPAHHAGLQANDVLTAINDQSLSLGNFFQIIDQYTPGQQIILTVTRGGQTIDLIVELASHPNRIVDGQSGWVQESVDLTPYVGTEVMVRFDYVTDQATSLSGWVIDDVEIPEISFVDDMETENAAWTSEGWVRIENIVPQNYLVQLVEYGNPTTVTRLLEAEDGQNGTWAVELGGGKRAVLAVSGIAPITRQPAVFDLTITPQ